MKIKNLMDQFPDRFRILDVAIAIPALFVAIIPMAAVALTVRVFLGSPIIHTQERKGLNEKIFRIYKFRSMKDAYDDQGHLLHNEYRMTKLGAFLRRHGLDEMPQLLNILKGDMSFIGPRALLEYNDSEGFKNRFKVRPGLMSTASAIEDARHKPITMEERIVLDQEQIAQQTVTTGIKIAFKCACNVFCGRHDIANRTKAKQQLHQKPYNI